MKKSILLAFLVFVLCAGAYADVVTVAGSTDGSYVSSTVGSVTSTTWSFDPGNNLSTLVYAGGATFSGDTTLTGVDLGSLTLTNGGNGGNIKSGTAELDLTVTFTTPGGSTTIDDQLSLSIVNGANGMEVVVTGTPSNSFTFGTETFTVMVNGLYDAASGGSLLSSLSVDNPGSGKATATGTAYLLGTISACTTGADGCGGTITGSDTPEPSSIFLLGSVLFGVTNIVRKKARRAVQNNNT
jgi:hypothetical protein